VARLLAIYGGRATALIELGLSDRTLAEPLDERRTCLAAEVVFAIREEFAGTLTDIVFRRLMVGLNADQGRPLYDAIASLAAAEFGWSPDEQQDQLRDLIRYADSLYAN
jgi:glycerol-3-phosphate dehydrogenase